MSEELTTETLPEEPQGIVEREREPTEDITKESVQDEIDLGDGRKWLFKRRHASNMFINELNKLAVSLKNDPCLPTEVLHKDQDPEALALVSQYMTNIRKLITVMVDKASGSSIDQYSFRLTHFMRFESWLNVVARLQFATSFKIVLDTLNENLSPDSKHKWGLLSIDDNGNYHIGDQIVKPGTLVDVFTTDAQVLNKVVLEGHETLNCSKIDDISLPTFRFTDEAMLSLSEEALKARADAKVRGGEHLVGVDAWSFLNGLFYHIADPDEDVIEIIPDILTKLDYDPAIKVEDYTKLGNMLNEEDLPFGVNFGLLVSLREHYCKNVKTFYRFKDNIEQLYNNQQGFRSAISEHPYVKKNNKGAITITSIHDMRQYLEGKSKILKVRLILADGKLVDAVTIDRPITLSNFGSFTRFNSSPITFNEIIYNQTEIENKRFMRRLGNKLLGQRWVEPVNPDLFKLTDNVFDSSEVVGFVLKETRAYYFDAESDVEKDPMYKMYHELKRKLKAFSL